MTELTSCQNCSMVPGSGGLEDDDRDLAVGLRLVVGESRVVLLLLGPDGLPLVATGDPGLALAAEVFELATARGLDRQALATILASGSGRSYAAEIVAGSGFDLQGLAAIAGPLLAKDVGILVDRAGLTDSTLLTAADTALVQMGTPRTQGRP